jgi:phosphoglycolate phosphatase
MEQSWIFDFDGTLVHSEAAITQCFQSITKKLAPHRLDVAKHVLIGPPLRQTVAEILGDPEHSLIDEFVNAFIQMHDDDVLNHTIPYPAVHETLAKLHQEGQKMALATNKRLAPTMKIIQHFNWGKFFIFVECSDSEAVMRDKNQMIKAILKKDSDFNGANFVGDTVGDGLSANISNIPFIMATYGYGSGQNWKGVAIHEKINSIKELISIN